MTSADDARQVADAAATGYVQVGNTRYPNSWVEPGKTVRQVSCAACEDTGKTRIKIGRLALRIRCSRCSAGDAA